MLFSRQELAYFPCCFPATLFPHIQTRKRPPIDGQSKPNSNHISSVSRTHIHTLRGAKASRPAVCLLSRLSFIIGCAHTHPTVRLPIEWPFEPGCRILLHSDELGSVEVLPAVQVLSSVRHTFLTGARRFESTGFFRTFMEGTQPK